MAALESTRMIAGAAAVLGVIAAIVATDAWWFLLGLIAAGVLYLDSNDSNTEKQ